MDLGLQDRKTDLNLGEPRKKYIKSGNAKYLRLQTQDIQNQISKLMLGNFLIYDFYRCWRV